jgi:hypothetical protein
LEDVISNAEDRNDEKKVGRDKYTGKSKYKGKRTAKITRTRRKNTRKLAALEKLLQKKRRTISVKGIKGSIGTFVGRTKGSIIYT